MMKILAIETRSTGDELGLKAGDDIVRINGHPVRDVLDYRFLVSEETVEMEVVQAGENVVYEIAKEYDDDLGLQFEDIEIRYCGNDCPFCFVDQNPAGMRSAMYFRDEDFRLSFLSGHYVTLTNLSKRDLDRIVWQRLSPLFVSVHATEPQVRQFLFGIDHDDRLLPKLDFLTQNGIEIHTQVVLCPGVNDGSVLEKTIWDLAKFLPHLKSVSVVPVGLTRHRQGLKKLQPVTRESAAAYLETIEAYADDFCRQMGEHFVYASDEFYLMVGESVPCSEWYAGFYQKENGVGMVRYMLDAFESQQASFPARLPGPLKATFVTATLVNRVVREHILPGLNKVENFTGQLAVVENRFYGPSIHVSGLLTGHDIYQHLAGQDLGDRVYLPANCLKDDTLFLDDWTLEELSTKLNRPVEPLDNDFVKIFENGF
ncbi:MAG: DUF512 domain-containing protein [bacterium]